MKRMLMMLAVIASVAFAGTTVQAQTKKTNTAQELVQSLETTTTQNGLINVGGVSVPVSNVTVQDLVNVQNVLNNAEINVLNNALNNNEVAKNVSVDLSNLLREAKLLNKNQIIVGVLSDQSGIRFVRQNARSAK